MISKSLLKKFYDELYQNAPLKWGGPSGVVRDEFAFKSLNEFFSEPPGNVLDIGCGNGHTLELFHNRWPDTKLYGLDLSAEALKIARARVPSANLLHGFLDEAAGLGLKGFFDLVTLLGVAEHFENLDDDLKSVLELLKPGGIAYFEIPNCIGYKESAKIEGFRELNVGSHQTEWHLFRETWDMKLKLAGFAVEKSLTGPMISAEFCYILRRPEEKKEVQSVLQDDTR